MRRGTCRYCHKAVEWYPTLAGKPMPVELGINPAGNVVIVDGRALVVGPDEQVEGRRMPHWADKDCELIRNGDTPQLSLTGAQLRDAAIEQVDRNAEADVKAAIVHIVRDFPKGTRFTTDRIWWHLERMGLEPHERRMIAGVLRRLENQQVIARTDERVSSKRKVCHAAPKQVYVRL